jgi:hypothetical protein
MASIFLSSAEGVEADDIGRAFGLARRHVIAFGRRDIGEFDGLWHRDLEL